MSPRDDPWIRGPVAPRRGVMLFCFAHAGGGAAFFQPWVHALAPEIDVYRVVLPGREARRREPPILRMHELVPRIASALCDRVDRPYALFGHSLGAAVAYEVARWMSAQGHPEPVHLFVSGRRAPHLPARRPSLHRLPRPELLRVVRALNGTPAEVLDMEDMMTALLPCLRADFELNETYVPWPGPRLRCPVRGLAGDRDPEVDLDELDAWREVTRGPFGHRLFPGDHFYLRPEQDALLQELRAALATPPERAL